MLKVLSLFDGISGAAQALKELGVEFEYYASEIDKYAIQVSKKNHSEIIQIGDIKHISCHKGFDGLKYLIWNNEGWDNYIKIEKVDLLIGGFPCQSFSGAGKGKGFEDERGQLFFEALRLLKQVKPKYFLFENVASMNKANQDFISDKIGVQPIMINSALLVAQNRKRLYWTNIPNIQQPEDAKVYLKDILQDLPDCPVGIKVREKSNCVRVGGQNSPFGSKQIWDSPFQRVDKRGRLKKGIEKAACLTGGGHSGGNHSDMDLIYINAAAQRGRYNLNGIIEQKVEISSPNKANCLTSVSKDSLVIERGILRRYSVNECEILQGFPINYCSSISKSQAYKALGNSFTVPVIKHILKNL